MVRGLSQWLLAAVAGAVLMPAGARAVSIDIGSASGAPGDAVTVAVSLHTMGVSVIATQNRIDFEPETPVAATASGDPDCAVKPAIRKAATSFLFLPLGCDPAVACQSVRALVLALDNVSTIRDGAVLYTCRIAIAADAQPGAYALSNAEMSASGPDGGEVPATGSDGSVAVTLAPVASIDVGSVASPAGSRTEFPVTLRLLTDPPADVAGVQNDVGFDVFTPVVATVDGGPACAVNPAIHKTATSFAFLPIGCTPNVDCTGVRAFVLSVTNPNPIADGATLYSCQVAIQADALLGSHGLRASGALASGPLGEILPTLSSDGAITVTAPPPVCVGDCNDDQTVAINELLLGTNILLGTIPLATCAALDANQDGAVTVDELVRAVNNALDGCPM